MDRMKDELKDKRVPFMDRAGTVLVRKDRKMNLGETCGSVGTCFIVYLLIMATLGGYCFGYSLETMVGTSVPWYLDVLGGWVLGTLAIPCAIVCAIFKASGVDTPFWNKPAPTPPPATQTAEAW